MDPVLNPFAPGAGSRPPEMAGRDAIIAAAKVALQRTKAGRHARSMMLLGLRGVGKTVLLVKIQELAEEAGYLTALLEAPEERRLAALIVPKLRQLLYRLSGVEKARILSNRALSALRSFASAFKVSYGDFELGVDAAPGFSASGDLDTDLADLFILIGTAAAEADRPIGILIDEVQYLGQEDLSALIVAIHTVGQRSLPLLVFGAGLPQLAALSGEARSYAERLFDYPSVGPLEQGEARRAVREPIRDAGAEIDDDALELIVERTEGYPYFLQEWGAHSLRCAPQSPIRRVDVQAASNDAQNALDTSFFRVRFDRLTPREQEYLRAMAHLGAGPHRSGDIADTLGTAVTSAGPLRTNLIRRGMIWSPSHGQTAFTVPLFHEYMKRAMPDWKSGAR